MVKVNKQWTQATYVNSAFGKVFSNKDAKES